MGGNLRLWRPVVSAALLIATLSGCKKEYITEIYQIPDDYTEFYQSFSASLTQVNAQIATLDAAVGLIGADTELASVRSDLTSLQSTLTTSLSDIRTAQDDLSPSICALLEAYVDAEILALAGELQDYADAADDGVKASLSTLGTGLSTLSTTVGTLQTKVTTLEGYRTELDALATASGQHGTAISENAAAIASLQNDLSSAVTTFNGRITNEVGAVAADLLVTAATLQNAINGKASAADLAAVAARVGVNENGIAYLLERMDALTSICTAHASELNSLKARMSAVEGTVETHSDLLVTHSARIDELDTRLTDLVLDFWYSLDLLLHRVGFLENQVGQLLSRIQSLTYIPDHADQKVHVGSVGWNYMMFNDMSMTFQVLPFEATLDIAQLFNEKPQSFSLILREYEEYSSKYQRMSPGNLTSVTANPINGTITATITSGYSVGAPIGNIEFALALRLQTYSGDMRQTPFVNVLADVSGEISR